MMGISPCAFSRQLIAAAEKPSGYLKEHMITNKSNPAAWAFLLLELEQAQK